MRFIMELKIFGSEVYRHPPVEKAPLMESLVQKGNFEPSVQLPPVFPVNLTLAPATFGVKKVYSDFASIVFPEPGLTLHQALSPLARTSTEKDKSRRAG